MKRSRARAPEAIEFARAQRAKLTSLPTRFGNGFATGKVCGQKFRREYAIPPYTVDFCSVELKLILESDGAEHLTEHGRERDRVRDEFLERHGYRVVRIAGYDVRREPGACLKRIEREVGVRMREMEARKTAHPQPLSPKRGEGR